MADRESNATVKVQATLAAKYKFAIVRGVPIHLQPSKSTFSAKRKAGDTNLDLYLDGTIYPVDPITNKRPDFQCLKSFLEFVGEGNSGLLGYINNVASGGRLALESILADQEERQIEVRLLRGRVEGLLSSWAQREQELHTERKLEAAILRSQILSLRNELTSLERSLNETKNSYEERIQQLVCRVDLALESEVSHVQKLDSIIKLHKSEIDNIREQLSTSNRSLRVLQRKMDRLKKTPYGFRQQIRPRKDIPSLSQKGGHAKAQKRLLRNVIAPATTRKIQEENAANACTKRLYGPKEIQAQTGALMANVLSHGEVESMLQSPNLKAVGMRMANYYISRIGAHVGPHEILEACDRSNVSSAGYAQVYKKFKGGVAAAGRGLKIACLLNPHQVSILRKSLNNKLHEFVGEYYSLESTLEIPGAHKSSKKKPLRVTLNNQNNLFVDVECVQRTIVNLYKITPQELAGEPLIFCLKLDEVEIVHAQKLERVSITLMNRALNPSITKGSAEYFSAQSEREIWPIGCFKVEKESHIVLKWVFDQTKLPRLIQAQESGQMLVVPGVGQFQVQWHMAGDMKTIKCMFNLKHGASSKYCCIYCMQERTKQATVGVDVAQKTMSKRPSTWTGGLFSRSVTSAPVSGSALTDRWQPILQIPLECVHICTLHALNRICEKMVHMHFMFIWTLRDKILQQQAITEMQQVLSSTGAHRGNVKIMKDEDLSGKNNNIPNKPSLNGTNSKKLFKPSTLSQGSQEALYIDIVNAKKNRLNNGKNRRGRLQTWKDLHALLPYFQGLTLSEEEKEAFPRLVQSFGKNYVDFFGEHHVSHYLHVFIRHAPWFVQQYGSLSIWSCQGMENSHHAAKATFQRHTQHGGGKSKISPLVQTYQHWFRIIQHRFYNKDKEAAIPTPSNLPDEEIIQRRREASLNSSASTHHALWRAKCTRIGSKWIPHSEIQVGGGGEEHTV